MTDQNTPSRRQQKPFNKEKIFWAQLTLFLEELWPALLPATGVLVLFLLTSLFDLWRYLPWGVHYAVLGLLAGLLVYLLVRDLQGLDWPSHEAALRRLEADGRVPHAPLQSLEDTPFDGNADNPLWQAHQKRMRHLARKTRLGKGRATIDQRDPLALRYGAVLLLIPAIASAWGDIPSRLWQAFSPQTNRGTPAIVDLWIDPPAYTGKAPIILVQSSPLKAGQKEQISVPAGAILHARIADAGQKWGRGRAQLEITTPNSRLRPKFERNDLSLMAETTLTQNLALSLSVAGQQASWPIQVVVDTPPQVLFREDPKTTDKNRVRMVVEIEDDYGITKAWAMMQLDPEQSRPLDAPALTPAALAEQETVPVSGINGDYGTRSAELDLMEHPWAGLAVRLRLVVEDGAGQTSETLTRTITLPERAFFNPLAKAVIYERRNLAIASNSWRKTGRAFDALTFAPDRFFNKPTDYLLLRTAYHGVMADEGKNPRETVDELWPLALQLEDQALELARRALETAATALREALERGAPESEVERLVENLRTAMNNYIQALAQSGQASAQGDTSEEPLGNSDLEDILSSINDLSRSGANNAARQLLSELEQMLQNLKISENGGSQGAGQGQASGQDRGQGSGQGRGGAGGQGQAGAEGQEGGMMGAAGDLIGEQRELADDTFATGQGARGGGRQKGLTPPRSLPELKANQQKLTEDLRTLLNDLKATTQDNDQTGQADAQDDTLEAFEQALEKMNQAEQALGFGSAPAAGLLQEEALQALREGADGLAEEFMNAQNRNGDQDGNGSERTKNNAANNNGVPKLDPLGRAYGAAQGEEIGIPDLSNPERARELIAKLRERLAQPDLSQQEIDYLERLLERF